MNNIFKKNFELFLEAEEEVDDDTEEEVDEYVNSLTQKQYAKLMTFFDTMPRIRHKIEYQNPKSGKKFSLMLFENQENNIQLTDYRNQKVKQIVNSLETCAMDIFGPTPVDWEVKYHPDDEDNEHLSPYVIPF